MRSKEEIQELELLSHIIEEQSPFAVANCIIGLIERYGIELSIKSVTQDYVTEVNKFSYEEDKYQDR